MIDLINTENFEKFVKDKEASLIYFSTPQCNVCKVLKPKIIELINTDYPKIKMGYVNCEQVKDVAAQNRIFTVPTIIVYLDGKEFIRKSRNINMAEFSNELERPYSLYFG
ncbi:MAG: thioredoxin family protein [Ignavibacteriae bacterium]|nr:thioredoxin family protein [Ignavibacteriota bacterium]MCB9208099.1 thioredoxin family protein [Ignavibacteriales bacterium]MCB9258865.1 thioredoxin family protein [Ignavibacteriales bacterium]